MRQEAGALMPPRRSRVPGPVVEALRLLVVVVGAQIGYLAAAATGAETGTAVLGAFDGLWLGAVLGGAFGYVVGGVVARATVTAVDRASAQMLGRSAEQVLAGAVGATVGAIVGTAMAWPLLFVGSFSIALPVFGFVVITTAALGHRLGLDRGSQLLRVVGQRRSSTVSDPASTSSMPRLIDTSAAIDGRILDVVRAGFLHGTFLVAPAVLAELQGLADAGDDLRRSRGRRGLEVLERLQELPGVDVVMIDDEVPDVPEVDAKLVRLARTRGAALLTLDSNLAKVARLSDVRVLNLHALTLALRPPVVAGDDVSVLLLKPGKEPGQAVGYLDDGTMVVVEDARDRIGSEAHVYVTSVLTTANGRMVFGRPSGHPATAPR
jgi:uncharacterized protein YacL